MKRRKGIYMQGSITLEASLVFPVVLFVILGIIRFGFHIHDLAAESMINEYAAVRERNMLWSSYDPVSRSIDLREIVNKSIIELENPYKERKRRYLQTVIADYKIRIQFDESKTESSGYEGVKTGLKNSTVVRTVHVLMNHAQDIAAGWNGGEDD